MIESSLPESAGDHLWVMLVTNGSDIAALSGRLHERKDVGWEKQQIIVLAPN